MVIVLFCRSSSDVSDEDEYYALIEQPSEEDVYGSLVALKSSRMNGSIKPADAMTSRHLPHVPVNRTITQSLQSVHYST